MSHARCTNKVNKKKQSLLQDLAQGGQIQHPKFKREQLQNDTIIIVCDIIQFFTIKVIYKSKFCIVVPFGMKEIQQN